MVNKAQAEASRLLKKYSISSPSLDDLIQIAGANGYEIIDYSLSNNPTNVTTLLHELSLEQLAATRRAFVFKRGEIRLLFVCDSMTSSEKRYAIAHELGHIVMGHLKNELCNDAEIEEEYEANEFAHYLLRPGFTARGAVWVRRHQAISILIVVFVALGIAAIPVTAMILKEQSYYYSRNTYVSELHTKRLEIFYKALRIIVIASQKGAHVPVRSWRLLIITK